MVREVTEHGIGVPVLIVDDNEAKSQALTAALDGLGVEAHRSNSGESALKKMLHGDFAVVLLDVKMPGIDGFETARLIRSRPRSAKTPIIFISSYSPTEIDLNAGYSLGAVDYIFSPINPHVVRSKVAVFVDLYRKSELLSLQAEHLEIKVRERTRDLEETQQRFRLMMDNVQDYAIIMLDTEGRFSTWNPGAQRLLGFEEAEVIGRSGFIIFTPEDIQNGEAAKELEVARLEGRATDERWHIRKDGTRFWGSGILTALRDKEGDLRGFVKILRDVSDRKKAEEANAAQLAYFKAMHVISQVLEANLDLEAILQETMERLIDLFDCDRAYLAQPEHPVEGQVSLPFMATRPAFPGPPRGTRLPMDDFNRGIFRAILDTSEPMAFGPYNPPPDFEANRRGHSIQSMLVIVLKPKVGKPWILGIHQCTESRDWTGEERRLFRDISHRITDTLSNLLFHRNLLESEERFRQLAEGLPQIIWTASPEGEWEYRNGRWFEYTGQSSTESLDASWPSLIHPEERDGIIARWKQSFETETPFLGEFRLRNAKGEYRWQLSLAQPIKDAQGHTWKWVGSLTDLETQKAAEIELRRSREQLSTILEGIADAIAMQDTAGNILYLNKAAAALLGYGTPQEALVAMHSPRGDKMRNAITVLDERGEPLLLENTPSYQAMRGIDAPPMVLRYRLAGRAEEKWVVSRAKPILDEAGKVHFVISITQDVTEIRKAEAELRQSQKMEAIGRLAGGIAHDFNNLLTAINGYSEVGLAGAAPENPLVPILKEILAAGQRAASLTNQLLAHSRKQVLAPKILDLNETVRGMERMLKRLIGEDIKLVSVLNPDVRLVKADPGQIEQVILNLALNSRDAMPQGGMLTLETSLVDLEPGSVGVDGEIVPGKYLVLSVGDTGQGMTKEEKERIFEPFFTTKAVGKGTGLGLSTVYGIVKQSGGFIQVHSEAGQGSNFRIFLPVVEDAGARPQVPEDEGTPSRQAMGETILLVEDEDSVRRLTKTILRSLEYTVLEADSAEAGLAIARKSGTRVHLLLTDVVMRGMGGQELANRMKELHPDIKVIFMSGYTNDAMLRHGVLESTAEFIQKPFSPRTLASRIGALLSSAPSATEKKAQKVEG